MSNSPLVEYTHISPFRNHPRNQPITKVTWHHTAGVCSLEQFDAIVHRPGRNMSANYCVDKDARVGLFCPEEDRCWCSSSAWNDNRSVVLEISNSKMGDPWPISDKVYKKCIELTVDICKRNGIKKLTFTGDKNGSLTFHRFYAATGCLPIHTTEVLTRKGWKLLKDVMVGDEIATVSPNDMYLTFSHVQNLVPVKKDTVYTRNGMTVTGDHRVLTVVNGADNKFVQFNELEESKDDYVVPAAAIASRNGIDMTSSEFVFLLEMQKIGKINDNNELEFTYIVESKKEFFQGLLTNIGFEYTKTQEDLGPVKFTITDKRAIELVNEYLVDGKEFNWRWLDLSPTQFSYFIYKVTHHVNGNWNRQYTSDSMTNIDIVQAICAINQRGTYYDQNKDILYVTKPYRIINEDTPVEKTEEDVEVSCVTVTSGAFLIRQHGVVTITGNCPGPYIFSKAQEICDLVNAQLNGDTPTPTPDPDPEPVVSDIKAGDLVSIKAGATWYQSDNKVPAWVIKQNWYVDSIIAQRAVLGKNEKGDSNIQSPIHVKNLTVVDKKEEPVDEKPKDEYPKKTLYTKSLPVGTIIHTVTNRKLVGTNGKITVGGFYTIIQEDMIGSVKYGQLKSGAGWVNLDNEDIAPTPTKEIKVGDYVKVVKGETYDGKKFVIYEKKYKVLQIKGDRVVISADGKNVTAAVRLNNCIKV